jgi:glycosyltransferase involved in cell wall biosynthesis
MTHEPSGLSVVVVGTAWPTVGGIASAIEDQRAALEELGVSVRVINTGESRRAAPNTVRIENVTAALNDSLRVFRSIRRGGERLAAIHTVASPLLPLVRVLGLVLGARLAGARVVLHLHGFDFEREVARGRRAYRLVGRMVGRLVDRAIALHPVMAQAAESLLGSQVVVIANGVAVRPLGSADEGRPRVRRALFVGTVGRRKGVLDLLGAARKSRIPVDVVGGPGEEPIEAHRAVVAEGRDVIQAGLAVFHGELARSRVQELLETTSVFILPSHAEGLPVSLLEAMERGVPVVVTDVGGMGALVGSSRCGIVVSVGDVDGIATAMERIVMDAELRRRMGAAARRTIVEEYDRTLVGAALANLYRAVARGGTESRGGSGSPPRDRERRRTRA